MTKTEFKSVYTKYEDYLFVTNASVYTRKAYLSNFKRYFIYCFNNGIEDVLIQENVKKYLVFRTRNGAKWQTMNNIYSAIKKLFVEILYLEWSFKKLPRPKMEFTLPRILSKEEVQKLINSVSNLKHQTIMITLYATGIRLNELRHLRVSDIDSKRLQIRITRGKGRKDRFVSIPDILIPVLRKYYLLFRPKDYLFYGKYVSDAISPRVVQWIFIQAKKRIGLNKNASPHVFRHCYATHHIESGTDLVFLKHNLGHKNLKTIEKYIHLCNKRIQHIIHPIANMDIPLLKMTTV